MRHAGNGGAEMGTHPEGDTGGCYAATSGEETRRGQRGDSAAEGAGLEQVRGRGERGAEGPGQVRGRGRGAEGPVRGRGRGGTRD